MLSSIITLSLSLLFFRFHDMITSQAPLHRASDLAAGSKLQPTKPRSEFLWVLESMDCFEPL